MSSRAIRPLLACAAVAAAFATPSAGAATVCAGTASTAAVCATPNPGGLPGVDPFGSSYDDCVYVGVPPCTPVSVPVPTVVPGSGQVVYLDCFGPLIDRLIACR